MTVQRQRRNLAFSILATVLVVAALACFPTRALGKEIEPLADAWTVVGENDTIPAGMHVRIDMTTGEKWVKQMDPHEQEQGTGSAAAATMALQVSGDATADNPASITSTTTKPNEDDINKPNYDYDRMYATLSQLPPEEHERMGGLPELPASKERTAVDRRLFEQRMKEIWEQRQEELRTIQQEQLVDLPEVLKTQISFLRNYINGQGDQSAQQIKENLHELEYLVTDVDMARDFHTLQGWPWLLALLVQRNATYDATTSTTTLTEELQAAAAWVVGTAVQNTGEFQPWVVEPVILPNGTIISALEGLMEVWNNQITTSSAPVLSQKVLYALSACLRGNPLAQHVFHQTDQAKRLLEDLRDTPADTTHGRKQILRILQLGHDLLAEWEHVLRAPGEATDAQSVAVVEQFRQIWVTAEWCNVVLDKSRVVTRADKRLPIISAWFSSCQERWDPARLQETLAMDQDDHADEDAKALQIELLQQITSR